MIQFRILDTIEKHPGINGKNIESSVEKFDDIYHAFTAQMITMIDKTLTDYQKHAWKGGISETGSISLLVTKIECNKIRGGRIEWEKINVLTVPKNCRKKLGNVDSSLLYSPQYYFKVPIENRLFFYPKDVLAALQKKFRPTPDCDGWLHKVWNALREKEERRQK